MKTCIHRHTHSDTHYKCFNTVDLVHDGTVLKQVCETCPYATDSPVRGAGDIAANVLKATGVTSLVRRLKGNSCGCSERQDIMNSLIPSASTLVDTNWAVALTTSPRPNPTLTCCVSSLRKAGWEPTIFAEPDSIEIPNTSYRWNDTRLGVWRNWLKAMNWALNETDAKCILSVQDDSLFHPDSKSFVESILWPSHRTGFISLYTAKHYSHDRSGNLKPTGVHKIKLSNLWGACALVFHRNVLQRVLDHPIAKSWLGVPPRTDTHKNRKEALAHRAANPETIQNNDTAIGKIMNALQVDMFFINPSPVHHIATHSSIAHGGNTGRRNCFRCADHSKPLADQVFPNKG